MRKIISIFLMVVLIGTTSVYAAPITILEGSLKITLDAKINTQSKTLDDFVPANGAVISLDFVFTNTAASRAVTVIFAVYEDGRLIGIKSNTGTAGSSPLSLNVPYTFNNSVTADTYAKILLIENFTTITPLRVLMRFGGEHNLFVYDDNNRLLTVQKMDGETIDFVYDDNGNLLTKTVTGGSQ